MLRSQRASTVASRSMPASMAKGRSLSGTTRPQRPTIPTTSNSPSMRSATLALPLANAFSTTTTRRRTAAVAAVAAVAASDGAIPPPPSPPRRRVVILPGLGNCDADYAKLAARLRARGAAVKVARVARIDWARNAAGLLLPEYWKGTLEPRPTVDWYLERIDEALEALNSEVSSSSISSSSSSSLPPLTLLAHSAGGWLGRVWMLSQDKDSGKEKAALVSDFVSVGSPHRPPPPGSSIPDQTRGILTWVERETPGSFHSEEHGVRYTTVASRFVKGAPLFGSGSGDDNSGSTLLEEDEEEERRRRSSGSGGGGGSSSSSFDSDDSDISLFAPDPNRRASSARKISIAQRLAGVGYEAVCGDAEAWGDGITPVASSHLPGAVALTLEGVFHSPLGATDDEDGEDGSKSGGDRPWYGSAGVLDQWVGAVFGEAPLAPATVDVTEARRAM